MVQAHLVEFTIVCGRVDWPETAKTILPSCSTSFTSMGGRSPSGTLAPDSCCCRHSSAASLMDGWLASDSRSSIVP